MSEEKAAWYVIHTNTSAENKVKANLEHRIQVMKMEDKIFEVLVPAEAPEKEPAGSKKKVRVAKNPASNFSRRIFPGYVLVRMILDDASWAVVRNTPGVTGFVGMGRRPTPLDEKEVENVRYQMGLHDVKPQTAQVSFKEGQQVKITEGPFSDFTGIVDKVSDDKKKLSVLVHIFGRETAVELGFNQVEEI